MSVSVEMRQLAAYTYLPGRMGDRISKCGSAFRGQARARRDHRHGHRQSHKLSTEGTADTALHAPRGPSSMDPQSRQNQAEGRAGGMGSARGGNVFPVLGEAVRGCTQLSTQPQL